MKKFRRLLTVILSLCLVCAVLPEYTAAAEEEEGDPVLKVREDGSLHILLVADTQDTEDPHPAMLELLNAELDAADADLVIFLGDNIYGPFIGKDRDKAEAAIRAVIDPVARRGLPFGIVFGNHDDEDCISKEEQLEIYRSYPGFLNEDPDIPGAGNTCLPVMAPGATEPSILLWLMDSGTYAEKEIGGYGYVTEEQNRWFRDTAASYSGSHPASYVFQHIPVPQAYELLEPAAPFAKGAIHSIYNPFSRWYREKPDAVREGRFGETPSPPRVDKGQFASWKDCGVRAAFFGHDHVNDYVGEVEGIDLVATCGIGFYSYGRGNEHGARILVLHTDRPEDYETHMVYYKDLIDKPLHLFQTPHLGVEIARIVAAVLGGPAAGIAAVLLLIRKLKRKRAGKKA